MAHDIIIEVHFNGEHVHNVSIRIRMVSICLGKRETHAQLNDIFIMVLFVM